MHYPRQTIGAYIHRSHMASLESNQLVVAAAAAAEDKKAEDIRILELDPSESGLCDYFIICNGTNERQNVAISDEIEFRLKKDFGVYANSVEGRRQAEWILLDYVDFVVHIFSAEKRAFYGLERLRKSAKTISVAELNAAIGERIKQSRVKKAAGGVKTSAVAKAAAKRTPAKKPAVKKVAVKGSVKKAAAKKAAIKSPVKAAKTTKKTIKKTAKKAPTKR